MRRIDPPGLGLATFPDAGPGRGKPAPRTPALQALTVTSFYHVEQGVILSVADRGAARGRGRYCCPAAAPAKRPPHASQIPRRDLKRAHARQHRRRCGCRKRGIGRQRGGRRAQPQRRTTAATHAISPDVYGMNLPRRRSPAALPVRRWGGNATTRYNYLNDTSNRAGLVLREHRRQRRPGHPAGRLRRQLVRRPGQAHGTRQHPHDAADRLGAEVAQRRVRLLGHQVRAAAADRPVASRLRQRRQGRRHERHRHRPDRHAAPPAPRTSTTG